MSQDDSTYDLIDQYLRGDLSEDHSFVQRMKEDQELAMEVEVQRAVANAVVDYRLMEVEKLIASRRKDFLSQASSRWKWVLGILSLGLVAGISYFYFFLSAGEALVQNENTEVKKVVLQPEVKQKEKASSIVQEQEQKTKSAPIVIFEAQKSQEVVNEAAPMVLEEVSPTPSNSAPTEKVTESHAKNEMIKIPTNPCVGIRMKAFIEERRPCMGSSEGMLTVKEAKGGTSPYHFSLDGKHFQETNVFTGLKANDYNIILRDANGCVAMVYEQYPLKSRLCTQFADHVFNPNAGVWDVPNDVDKQGEMAIFDRNGQRVYFRPFDKAEKLNWAGTQNSGELLLPGVYIYTIKYADGAVDQGRITIAY